MCVLRMCYRYEWGLVQDLARIPHLLPQSISFELHFMTQMRGLAWFGRLRTPYEIGAWMDYLFTRGGYVLVDRHDNRKCGHCTEIVVASLGRSCGGQRRSSSRL